MKEKLLVIVTTLVLIAATSPVQDTIALESRRSLGNGRLAALLASPNSAIAARAALAIGRTKQPGGAPLLARSARDERAGVRALSIFGLALIELRASAPLVLHALSDSDSSVRVAAIEGLARYEDDMRLESLENLAQSRLEHALVQDKNPDVRGAAAIALASFARSARASSAVQSLERAVERDRANGVRERAMWSLYRAYAPHLSRAFLRSTLRDRDEIVRIEAVRAYGNAHDARAIGDLSVALVDPSWRVQEQAIESMRILRGASPTAHLTVIPSFVHIPAPKPDPYASLPALARSRVHAGPPRASDVPSAPPIDPRTARMMLSPAHGLHPRVRLRTSEGNIYVALYPEWAPLTVANFLNLVNRGFFDDNRWFRIVSDFVVQTGEKDDVKAPGPGYTIPAEENPLQQNSYVISMGLDYDMKTMTPKRDSAGSEYYITLSPQYHLDRAFTVFGRVISGFDVLARLTEHDRVIRIERVPDVML